VSEIVERVDAASVLFPDIRAGTVTESDTFGDQT
jgi:hypothetical protein